MSDEEAVPKRSRHFKSIAVRTIKEYWPEVMPTRRDVSGMTVRKLTVIKPLFRIKEKGSASWVWHWLCRCECGNEVDLVHPLRKANCGSCPPPPRKKGFNKRTCCIREHIPCMHYDDCLTERVEKKLNVSSKYTADEQCYLGDTTDNRRPYRGTYEESGPAPGCVPVAEDCHHR